MNSGKLALGLVVGATIGAAIGIIFAPAKGKVLRRKIQSMSVKEADVLKDKYNGFAENMSKKYEKAKENIVDFAHQSMNTNHEKVKTAENN